MVGVLALAFGFRSDHKSARDLQSSGEHTLPLWWIGAFAVVLAVLGVAGLGLVR